MSEEIKNPDSFIFYRSFLAAIKEADEASQLQLYRAISFYALDREEPQLHGMVKAVWEVIKPQIDANFKRYANGCKGGSHGKKGGAPKGNSNARKITPKQPRNNPETTPNNNNNENENENEKFNGNGESEREGDLNTRPPSLEIIKDFVRSNNLNVDAEKFYCHYQSSGWRNVSDWQAKIRYWHLQDEEKKRVVNDRIVGYGLEGHHKNNERIGSGISRPEYKVGQPTSAGIYHKGLIVPSCGLRRPEWEERGDTSAGVPFRGQIVPDCGLIMPAEENDEIPF